MTILPLTYLGNTEYFSLLLQEECIIDLYEHYIKQSYRNRCEIMTATGTAALTVNVVKGGSIVKRPVRDIQIVSSKRWQHHHWTAITSAYRNSPYFDHYCDLFAPFYEKRFRFLADLNIPLAETIVKILGSPGSLRFSDSYVETSTGDTDLRGAFKPSADRTRMPPATHEYQQVFSDRQPFAPNLSVIDLIFCEGPAAADILRGSIR